MAYHGHLRVRVWHPNVPHPNQFLHAGTGAKRVNSLMATRLAIMFGSVWTIWTFLLVPLAALWMPDSAQKIVFFLASGWIQLFALPLFVWVANTTSATQAAKAEADHTALSHIATQVDALVAATIRQ